ncbi:ankyrin repeat domain-containing protein [Hymenobacter sp. 5516J-16]|uniref:Ankyrin repeat domain-containing protein n=1 Tax=Hymenobacter sublimis TaxID=2933777 RepID=A0ABY4J3Y7_9BACT|nr:MULTISPECIES: ankyrin repeat domain-containing protein [Hymenobacter]UOQ77579.1 ankyrin repeat domain-containing protein [Hymenobacter sp. 5516J-16]UPL47558.1 ankyrin repeat domain-containing protein [Hymenobacter sublimis]
MKKLLLAITLFLAATTFSQAQTPTQKVYAAVIKNKPADVDALLSAGADANATVEMMPGFPTTFLIIAAGNGHLEVVKALVKNKAQVDKPDSFNATALMAAAANGSLAVVEFLLASGANPKAKDKDGKDVLASAKEGGNAEVLKLIQAKAK